MNEANEWMNKQMNKQINLFPKTNFHPRVKYLSTLCHEKKDIDIIRAIGMINSLHDFFFWTKGENRFEEQEISRYPNIFKILLVNEIEHSDNVTNTIV